MSVALRTITRLQDADDINVSLGAGVDEYALCWDNDTAKFVLRAMSGGGVTDHGALTGLADDDHTQYLLATGARTGASSQAQTFTHGIIGPTWKPASDSTTALQVQNAAGTAILTVDTTNKFVGVGVTPTAPLHVKTASSDVLCHFEQTGAWNNTNYALAVTGYANLGGFRVNGADTLNSFYSASSFGFTTAAGNEISFNHWTGALLTRMFIGSTGLIGIGTTSPATLLHPLLSSSATNAVTNVVTIGHDSTGTAANGFGAGLLFALESSTTNGQSAARIQALWNDATHATRKADLVLSAYDTAEREGLRIRGAGSAAAIGFYGVAPIERATLATGAGATVDNVITALQNLGLVKQS